MVVSNQLLWGPHKWKNQWFDGGQVNDPEILFSLFLPATPLPLSWTLEGLFELTRHPSRALDSPRVLLPGLQRYKDTVMCAALGAEVPGRRQKQPTQTLIVRLLKTHFYTPILDCEKSTEYNWVSDQTWPPTVLCLAAEEWTGPSIGEPEISCAQSAPPFKDAKPAMPR